MQVTCPRRARRLRRHPVRFGAIRNQNYRKLPTDSADEPEKNERSNVTDKEVEALQRLAADLPRLSPSQLVEHVESDALKEICHDSQNQGRKQDS